MIRFTAAPTVGTSGDVVGVFYDDLTRSFWLSGPHDQEVHSILVNDLEIHIDAEGRVISVDGYAPRGSWIESAALPPAATYGEIRAEHSRDLVRGASVRLTSPAEWPSYINAPEGWLCVGNPHAAQGGQAVKLDSGAILVLHGDQLEAIWLPFRPAHREARFLQSL